MENKLTHFDKSGNAKMVDVSEKHETQEWLLLFQKL